MSEDELQEGIRHLCLELGLLVQHITDARRSWLPGWPDLVIIGPRGVLYRELKRQDDNPTPNQKLVGAALKTAGQDWDVWRPNDLIGGSIMCELLGIWHA